MSPKIMYYGSKRVNVTGYGLTLQH